MPPIKKYQCECGETDPANFPRNKKSKCKKCKQAYNKQWFAKNKKAMREYQNAYHCKGPKQFLHQLLVRCRKKDKARGQVVETVNIDQLMEIYDDQEGLCFYTNVSMTHERNNLRSISVDRIDSAYGYIPGNIVLCCKGVNLMKHDHSVEQFKEFLDEIFEKIGQWQMMPS